MGYYTVLIISHDECPSWDDAKTVKVLSAVTNVMMGGRESLPAGITGRQFHNTDKKLDKIRKLVK